MQHRRLFVNHDLREGVRARLDTEQAHRVTRVLRLHPGDSIRIFNADGVEFLAQLERDGRIWSVVAREPLSPQPVSPLHIVLGQAIARGDRMDFTLQKAVELGVAEIQPLLCERSHFAGDAARHRKRLQHWQRIVVQACEQCGRSHMPPVHEPLSLSDWLSHRSGGWLLQPGSGLSAAETPFDATDPALLVGPEGGFSENEIELALAQGLTRVSLGPRTLRTETTALVALTVLQLRGGDLQ